jgi:hypothetical protein
MADIKFTGSADFSQVEKSYAKLEADVKRLEEQAVKLARAAENGGTAQQRAADRAAEAAQKARGSVDQLAASLGKSGSAGAKSGDDIKKAYDSATRDVAKLETANHRLAKSIDTTAEKQKSAGDAARDFASEGLSQIRSLAFEWVSLGGIISQMGEAYNRVGENRKKALEAHLGQAPAEELVIKNLVGVTPKQKQEVLRSLDDMAKEIGVEAGPVKRAFAEAISKAGGDIPLALESTRAAISIHRMSPDQANVTTAAAATLSRAMGLRDPRQALGFAASTQASTAESSQPAVMGTLPGVVNAVVSSAPNANRVRTAEEAAAVLAALNQAAPGPGLSSAGTAEIGLAAQLRLFFKPNPLSDEEKDIKAGQKARLLSRVQTLRKNRKGDSAPVVDAQIRRAEAQINILDREIAGMGVAADPGTFSGRIAAVQASEDLQNRLIPTIHGEASFVDAMKDLLRGKEDSRVYQEYQANLKRIKVGSADYEQQAAELSPSKGLTPAIRIGAATESGKAASEAELLTRNKDAEMTRIKQEASQLLEESAGNLRESVDVQEHKLLGWMANLYQSPTETAVGKVLHQAQLIRERYGAEAGNKQRKKGSGFFATYSAEPATDEQLPPEVRQRVKTLEKRGMELRQAFLRAQRGVAPELPNVTPDADREMPEATVPASTAEAAAEASNAYRELPTVADYKGSGSSPKVSKAAQRNSHAEKQRLASRLKKIQGELSGHGAALKRPGYREQLQAEAEQLQGQIAAAESGDDIPEKYKTKMGRDRADFAEAQTAGYVPEGMDERAFRIIPQNAYEQALRGQRAAQAERNAATPAPDQSALLELNRQQLEEQKRMTGALGAMRLQLGGSAARQDLADAIR